MVVFWKEDSGRRPHLITPENEGGDETSYPSPPKFLDDPDVPFGPSGPPEHPRPPGPPGPPGPPPGWPPAPSPAGDGERVELESTSRERLPLRPSPPEPQLIPTPMNDGDDDHSPQEERQRWRSRSRERVYPHAQVSQEAQIQPMVTPEADEVSDEDFSDVNPSSPATGPPPSAEQRSRSRRDERSRSREQTPPHSSSQDVDEDWAKVDPQNRVSDRSRSPQEREASRRQDPQQQRGKKTVAEEQPSDPPKAKKTQVYWFRWRRWRTSKWALNLFKHTTYCTSTSLWIWWWRQWVQRWILCTKLGLRKDFVLPRSLRSDWWWALDNDTWDTRICSSSWIILFFNEWKWRSTRHMQFDQRFPRKAERVPTDWFPCFHKTRISDELPNGSQQRMGSFPLWSQNSFSSMTILWCEPWCCVSIATRSRSSSIHCCET